MLFTSLHIHVQFQLVSLRLSKEWPARLNSHSSIHRLGGRKMWKEKGKTQNSLSLPHTPALHKICKLEGTLDNPTSPFYFCGEREVQG